MAKAAKKNTAVAVRENKAVATTDLPKFLQGYKGPLGTEDIDSGDVTIPRLKIGQAISEEVKSGKAAEGDLFLNVTGEVVCPVGEELPCLIVARSKEFILWRPREDNGGGILARAKPVREGGVTRYRWDKPNQSFEVKVGGKVKVVWKTKEYIDQDGLGEWGSEIPGDKESGIAATAHHNYLVLLPTHNSVVAAVSMSKSGVKKAKDLNAALKMGDIRYPMPTRKFSLSTVDDKGQGGDDYKNWSVKPDGYLDLDGEDADLGRLAMNFFTGFSQTGYSVDQSDAEQDAGPTEARGKPGRV